MPRSMSVIWVQRQQTLDTTTREAITPSSLVTIWHTGMRWWMSLAKAVLVKLRVVSTTKPETWSRSRSSETKSGFTNKHSLRLTYCRSCGTGWVWSLRAQNWPMLTYLGSPQQTQHGQLYPELLLSWPSVYLNGAPWHELVWVDQVPWLPRLLSEAHSPVRQAAAQQSSPSEGTQSHSLRPEARKCSACTSHAIRNQGHRLRIQLPRERKSLYLHSVALLPITRGHFRYDLRHANRHVESGLYPCGTPDGVPHLSWGEWAGAAGLHYGSLRSTRKTPDREKYPQEALLWFIG